MSYNLEKPNIPAASFTTSGAYPYLASVGVTEATLATSCVKRMRVIAITGPQTINVIDENDRIFTNIPVWVHTDIGARLALLKGVEAVAADYFKNAAFMFTFMGEDEETYSYVAVLTNKNTGQAIGVIDIIVAPMHTPGETRWIGSQGALKNQMKKSKDLSSPRPTYTPYLRVRGFFSGATVYLDDTFCPGYPLKQYRVTSSPFIYSGLYDLTTGALAVVPTYNEDEEPGSPYEQTRVYVVRTLPQGTYDYYAYTLTTGGGSWRIPTDADDHSPQSPEIEAAIRNFKLFTTESLAVSTNSIIPRVIHYGDQGLGNPLWYSRDLDGTLSSVPGGSGWLGGNSGYSLGPALWGSTYEVQASWRPNPIAVLWGWAEDHAWFKDFEAHDYPVKDQYLPMQPDFWDAKTRRYLYYEHNDHTSVIETRQEVRYTLLLNYDILPITSWPHISWGTRPQDTVDRFTATDRNYTVGLTLHPTTFDAIDSIDYEWNYSVDLVPAQDGADMQACSVAPFFVSLYDTFYVGHTSHGVVIHKWDRTQNGVWAQEICGYWSELHPNDIYSVDNFERECEIFEHTKTTGNSLLDLHSKPLYKGSNISPIIQDFIIKANEAYQENFYSGGVTLQSQDLETVVETFLWRGFYKEVYSYHAPYLINGQYFDYYSGCIHAELLFIPTDLDMYL